MSKPLSERLIEAREGSGISKAKHAAEQAGITPSALYQLESGKTRSLAGDTAEKLGRVYTKYRVEWLISGRGRPTHAEVGEKGVSEPPSPSYASQPLGIDPAILSASIKLVRMACEQLDVDYDPEQDAGIIALGYSYLYARSQRAVTPENLVDFTKRLRKRLSEATTDGRSESIGTTGPGVGAKGAGSASR